MNYIAYKLYFTSPLHLGTVEKEEMTDEILHSDTLFSSIISRWNTFYDDNMEEIIKNPPFLISSAFPFKEDEFFFPRPMVRIRKEEDDDVYIGKKLKKVKFLSKILFEKVLNGEEIKFSNEILEKNTFQNGIFWTNYNCSELPEEKQIVYKKVEKPRVIIDRIKNSSQIFYFNEIFYSKNAGLFFLVRFNEEKFRKKFQTILSFLGDEGIGGDRSSGKGLFKLDIVENFELRTPETSEFFTSLSLYHPTKEEIEKGLLKNSSYELITRKGWIYSNSATSIRKKSLRMFKEGSVFTNIGKELYGDIKKVFEKNSELGILHDVYRYGIGFCVPLKIREENG